jgi:hypothetical protein
MSITTNYNFTEPGQNNEHPFFMMKVLIKKSANWSKLIIKEDGKHIYF